MRTDSTVIFFFLFWKLFDSIFTRAFRLCASGFSQFPIFSPPASNTFNFSMKIPQSAVKLYERETLLQRGIRNKVFIQIGCNRTTKCFVIWINNWIKSIIMCKYQFNHHHGTNFPSSLHATIDMKMSFPFSTHNNNISLSLSNVYEMIRPDNTTKNFDGSLLIWKNKQIVAWFR